MRGKRKKMLSFLMALSVFMTGSGIGSTSAVIASDDIIPEQYTVTLPACEACDYEYDVSHRKENSDADQNIILQYEAGENVTFHVVPRESWRIETLSVLDSNKKEISITRQEQSIRFPMPEDHVFLQAEFRQSIPESEETQSFDDSAETEEEKESEPETETVPSGETEKSSEENQQTETTTEETPASDTESPNTETMTESDADLPDFVETEESEKEENENESENAPDESEEMAVTEKESEETPPSERNDEEDEHLTETESESEMLYDFMPFAIDPANDDPVPNRFKLVVEGICGAPESLNNNHATTTHKKIVFLESDGTTIVREAYCIQPRLNSPESGTVYDKNTAEYLDGTSGTQSERRMSKGMFYLYGGPGWGKTIELSDGSSVNLKSLMDNAGCSTAGNYYTITHYVLSYFYLNGTDWNYNSNYANALNAAGVELVRTLVSSINRMPNPNTRLTVTELQATYQKSSGKRITSSVVYKSFEENTASVTLPKGITLVNETTGERLTGKVSLNSGNRFHLEADQTAAEGLTELIFTCRYPVDYQALKLGMKGYQDIGFSYYSGEKDLSLKVTLPELPKSGTAYVQKLDSVSESTKLLNENYSLAGAVYTVYKDQNCTQQAVSLTTTENGKTNQVELEAGTYYVKETKPSKGYQLDEKLYTLKVVSGETATFTSYEVPIQKKLSVQKYDAQTGKTTPQSGSFEGAEYTVYLDEACTKKAAVLKTDKNGYAESDLLPLAVYYIKETKAPAGYELDLVVHRIAMAAGGETTVYPTNSRENPIKKFIEIQKYDAQTGNTKPYNDKYSFANAEYTIYRDASCTQKVETIKTNASGYAKSSELAIATYYVKETKAPSGYTLDKTVYKVEMNVSGTVKYTVKSEEVPQSAKIRIQKWDADTGKAEPYNKKVSFRGAEYIIYSDAACTKKVEVLSTDDSGKAESGELPLGIYYIKENVAPAGYRLDKTIHKIDINEENLLKIYVVRSDEEVEKRPIEVQKYDKETGKKSPAAGTSFAGAQYSIYTDALCTKEVDVITTNASGYGRSKDLPLGVYYVKETKRPNGYELDPTVHQIDMKFEDQVAVYPVISEEQVIRKPIELQKFDKETGKAEPNNSAVKFEGAQYTIYRDKECTEALEILTLNTAGYAKSSALLPGTYYIKETKAPSGYEMDELIHEVTVADDGQKTYQLRSDDPVIRGSLMLMKFLDDRYDESVLQEWIDRGELAGIRFTLTHEDPSVPEKEITTDSYGYAATKANELVYGTWILQEDPATTPEGYAGLKKAKIKITEQGVQVKYVVTNSVENAVLEIVKKDSQTGNLIPKTGVKFQILDESGTPVVMQDNLDFSKITDTFTTNAEGKIYLTRPLKKGTYTLKEIEAPENYLTAKPQVFTVDGAHSYEEPLVVECFDEMQKGRIVIQKQDAQTQQPLGEGFTFEIRTAEDITDPAGTVLTMETTDGPVALKKGALVAVISTNSEGVAFSPELYLGKYEIREVSAGEFYAVSDQVYEAELTYDSTKVSVEAECSVENKKTTLILQKEDAEATEEEPLPLAGIHFRIFTAQELEAIEEDAGQIPEEVLAALGTEYMTDENGQIEITNLKHNTIYYIYESKTLPGYNLEHGLYKISVDANGLIADQPCYTMKISNQANQAEITKWDITGGCELPGAELTIRNEDGTVIEQWISEETPHRIKGLAAGTYTLTEERAPLGYAVAESITFTLTDSLEVQQVVMKDEQIQVQISKKDITGQEELPGAQLEVRTEDGTLIDAWVSAEGPHFLNLAAGNYTLTEVAAPEKYARAETISFEVRDDLALQKVEMRDAPIQVQISKQDITDGKELPGAQLTVRDAQGAIVADWTSTEEPHYLNLAAGTYTLTEVVAPSGYCKAETITFEVTDTAEIQKVVMYDRPIEAEISKQDIAGDKELPGALLVIRDTDGNEIDRWYSEEKPHRIQLACGTYVLTEIAAPDYYATAESITFEIKETGEVQKVVMKDAPLQVAISKRTITGEEELPGAVLKVSDLDGNILETWVSGKEPHMIRLKKGVYELAEITAPDGYEIAETIRFTVEDTMKVQTVIMYDKPIPETESESETEKETETEHKPEETESETLKETESETEKKTEKETEPRKPSVPGVVKTGDPTDFFPPLFGLVSGFLILTGILVSDRTKKKRKNQKQ